MKDILCIIPARSGSKGVKNKNFLKVKGKMLIQYTIDSAKKISKYCDILISSDSPKTEKICKKNNLKFYGLRPKKLSGDKVETYKVVNYELKKIEKGIKTYKYILLLQPTCPLRDYRKLLKAIKKIKSKKYDSVISIKDVNENHPLRMKKIVNNYVINYADINKENMKPRQSLPKVYIRSGSIYLFERNVLLKQKSMVGKKCYGIILSGKETINIDTYENLNEFKKNL
jgi:CMP-N,N'-diacetyllegionaminic acid synthase